MKSVTSSMKAEELDRESRTPWQGTEVRKKGANEGFKNHAEENTGCKPLQALRISALEARLLE